MQHLPIERLADLGETEPTATEREHLAACNMCATELKAYQRIVAMASDEHRRIAPPLTNWGALRSEMLDERLIVTAESRVPMRPAFSKLLTVTQRAAAALVLLAGGTVLGRLTTGLPLSQAVAVTDWSGQRQNGLTNVAMTGQEFSSTATALTALQKAQQEYEQAAQYLALHDTTTSESASELYRARLVALDKMAETSLRALQQRPQDPIMNQVYLTTLGARNLTLTKLGAALTSGNKLTRF